MALPRIKPVYNVGDYGVDIFLPLNFGSNPTTTITSQSITVDDAATNILTTLDGTAIPVDDNDIVLMQNNILGLLHQGNGVQFTQTLTWTPDMSATVYKTSLQIAYAVNCSAFTSGTINIGKFRIKAVERGTGRVLIPELTFPQINAQLVAVGTSITILMADYTAFYEVKSKAPVDITITMGVVTTGTNTTQGGILPIFCYTQPNIVKPFSASGVKFHVHPSTNHADPVFALSTGRVEL